MVANVCGSSSRIVEDILQKMFVRNVVHMKWLIVLTYIDAGER